MPRPMRVFLDASVLYPVSLRNLLMRLTLDGLYQARWSPDVHREWIGAVLRDNLHIPRERLEAIRDAMDDQAQDALVTGYERRVGRLLLPDPDDRHMLAAAIVCGARVIVTRNLRDFPADKLTPFRIEALHPDVFLRRLLDRSPQAVADAVRSQHARLRNPPLPMADLLAVFLRLDLVETVAALRRSMPE